MAARARRASWPAFHGGPRAREPGVDHADALARRFRQAHGRGEVGRNVVATPPTAFEATSPREPMTVTSERWSFESRLVMSVFWLVAIATQLNWNHIANMIVGTGWFVTLGLALCGVFLLLAVRIPFRRALGLPGCLVVAALTFYVVISIGVTILTKAGWHPGDGRRLFLAGVAMITIVASAFGAQVVLRRIGTERLLARILVIKAVVCILILASPFLAEHFYHALSPYYRSVSEFRFMGPFKGPNLAGGAACEAVVLALCLLNSRYRRFAWWVVIFGSAAAVMTFSRTAIIALILVLAFFLWSSTLGVRSGRRPAAEWLTPVFVAGVLGLMAVNLEHLPLVEKQWERIEWVLTFGASGNIGDRFELWRHGTSLIAESPLFGHGFSQFRFLDGTSCTAETGPDTVACGVHNTYMLLWGEAGIVPLALFLLFLGVLLGRRFMLPKSIAIDTVTGWTLILAVQCMATDGVPFFAWNAFIIGLSCALAAHAGREARVRKEGRAPETQPASVRPAPYGASP